LPGGSEVFDGKSQVERAKHRLMIHRAAGAAAP
jgi:hypothetical protein